MCMFVHMAMLMSWLSVDVFEQLHLCVSVKYGTLRSWICVCVCIVCFVCISVYECVCM